MRTLKLAARCPLPEVKRRGGPRRTAAKQGAPAAPDVSDAMGAALVVVEPMTARRWAQADASEFVRMRSVQSKRNAMNAIAGYMRASPAYAAALAQQAPGLAANGKAINDEWTTLRDAVIQALQREQARAQPR